MGDSDDDREFKRRDKFHTERRGHDGGERFGGGEWREPRPGPPPGGGGEPACLAHAMQKFMYIVGLAALRLAFFTGNEY